MGGETVAMDITMVRRAGTTGMSIEGKVDKTKEEIEQARRKISELANSENDSYAGDQPYKTINKVY